MLIIRGGRPNGPVLGGVVVVAVAAVLGGVVVDGLLVELRGVDVVSLGSSGVGIGNTRGGRDRAARGLLLRAHQLAVAREGEGTVAALTVLVLLGALLAARHRPEARGRARGSSGRGARGGPARLGRRVQGAGRKLRGTARTHSASLTIDLERRGQAGLAGAALAHGEAEVQVREVFVVGGVEAVVDGVQHPSLGHKLGKPDLLHRVTIVKV
mmetsp:Transcript_29350/g.72475  ORF Transcript_29350/g.72475 Transcript_29350/m.72475 type:complete len:212 (-) Transcript_29350:344-979(-)